MYLYKQTRCTFIDPYTHTNIYIRLLKTLLENKLLYQLNIHDSSESSYTALCTCHLPVLMVLTCHGAGASHCVCRHLL